MPVAPHLHLLPFEAMPRLACRLHGRVCASLARVCVCVCVYVCCAPRCALAASWGLRNVPVSGCRRSSKRRRLSRQIVRLLYCTESTVRFTGRLYQCCITRGRRERSSWVFSVGCSCARLTQWGGAARGRLVGAYGGGGVHESARLSRSVPGLVAHFLGVCMLLICTMLFESASTACGL